MFLGPNITFGFIVALALYCEGSVRLSRRHLRIGVPPPPPADVSQERLWFIQRLDHSRPSDTTRWNQLYFVAKDYYIEGGPVFIMIEGEGPAEAIRDDAWVEYAKKYNAMMFVLEHRYYGQSHPTSDLRVENLKYLTSEQALADVAYFIEGMNRQYMLPPDTKWVAFGGSYAGNLAAWVRYKYPHLVHAAVASSAPVLAQVDFREYLDVVRVSLSTHSRECVQAVEDAHRRVKSLLKTQHGREMIRVNFRLCYSIDPRNQNDVAVLLEELSSPFSNVVQYNKGSTEYLSINNFCNIMVDRNIRDPLSRYATVIKMYRQALHLECWDYKYDNLIYSMKKTNYPDQPGPGPRQWFYQQCTEFGYFPTSENKRALFGKDFPLDFYTQQCGDIFGKKFTKESIYRAVDKTNKIYGGLNINATRVAYVHGSIDPWHALGITKTRIPESPAIFINGTSHCADMLPRTYSDPPALTAAREKIYSLIGTWLREQY